MRTILTVSVVVLAGFCLVPSSDGKPPPKQACYQECSEAMRECVQASHSAVASRCTGTKAQVRRCRRAMKRALRLGSPTCGNQNADCRECCRRGGEDCAGAPTSTSTTTPVP